MISADRHFTARPTAPSPRRYTPGPVTSSPATTRLRTCWRRAPRRFARPPYFADDPARTQRPRPPGWAPGGGTNGYRQAARRAGRSPIGGVGRVRPDRPLCCRPGGLRPRNVLSQPADRLATIDGAARMTTDATSHGRGCDRGTEPTVPPPGKILSGPVPAGRGPEPWLVGRRAATLGPPVRYRLRFCLLTVVVCRQRDAQVGPAWEADRARSLAGTAIASRRSPSLRRVLRAAARRGRPSHPGHLGPILIGFWLPVNRW
jgi:hypothetical protein